MQISRLKHTRIQSTSQKPQTDATATEACQNGDSLDRLGRSDNFEQTWGNSGKHDNQMEDLHKG